MLEPKRKTNYEDLTGQIFGRWKVIKQGDYVPHGTKGAIMRTWICECQCDNKTIKQICEPSLKNGTSKSCGCLQKEAVIKSAFKRRTLNKYDLSGEYGIGYTTNTNEPFYFDLEDYDKIKEYTWFRDGDKYVVTSQWKERRYLYLHKLTMNTDHLTDHINRNKMDCRKENLRVCTEQQNAINRTISVLNTSGIIGVNWRKDKHKWRAYIRINGKQISLGNFLNKENAIKARLKAETKYFGEFAPQKHLFEQYGIEEEINNE